MRHDMTEDPVLEYNHTAHPVLRCPSCDSINLHQEGVESFERGRDGNRRVDVTYREGVEIDDSIEETPSDRRDGIKIRFTCEICTGPEVTPVYVLCISQHKGEEHIYWAKTERRPTETV